MTDEEPQPKGLDADKIKEQQSKNPSGLYTQSGRLLFESPSTEAVAELERIDPRVTYFRYRIPDISTVEELSTDKPLTFVTPEGPQNTYPIPEESLEFYNEVNRAGIPVNLFDHESVLTHLEEYLAEKYQGRNVAVRGTATTLLTQHAVEVEGSVITTPIDILRMGIERGGKKGQEYAPMIGFDPKDPEINFRSVQWLTQHPEELRKKARQEGHEDIARSIYPVLLVYDRTKFPEGSTVLPEDPSERAKCILEAVVLDYPLSRQEYNQQ